MRTWELWHVNIWSCFLFICDTPDFSAGASLTQIWSKIKLNKLFSNIKKSRCVFSWLRKSHKLTQNCTDYVIIPDTSPTAPVVPPQSGLVTFIVSHQNIKRAQAGKKVRFCHGALDRIAMFFPLQRCKASVCIFTTEIEPFLFTKVTCYHYKKEISVRCGSRKMIGV